MPPTLFRTHGTDRFTHPAALRTAGGRYVLLPCAALFFALTACTQTTQKPAKSADLPAPQYYDSTGQAISASKVPSPAQPRQTQQPPQQQASATPQSAEPQPPAAPARNEKIVPVTDDECAEQLGNICSVLLLYLKAQIDAHVEPELPPTLKELTLITSRFPTLPELKFNCPVTNEPYGYAPQGLIIPNDYGRIIVWDTKPAVHKKNQPAVRWAIRVFPAVEGRPPTASPIPLTEEMFSKLRAP